MWIIFKKTRYYRVIVWIFLGKVCGQESDALRVRVIQLGNHVPEHNAVATKVTARFYIGLLFGIMLHVFRVINPRNSEKNQDFFEDEIILQKYSNLRGKVLFAIVNSVLFQFETLSTSLLYWRTFESILK